MIATQEALSAKKLSEQIDLVSGELERLSEEMVGLRRNQRADHDRLVLEIEAIKLFLRETHPELRSRLTALHEQARRELVPE